MNRQSDHGENDYKPNQISFGGVNVNTGICPGVSSSGRGAGPHHLFFMIKLLGGTSTMEQFVSSDIRLLKLGSFR